MPRITSDTSYSSGPRRQASAFNVKKFLVVVLVLLVVAGIAAGLFMNRDTIISSAKSLGKDKEVTGPKDPGAAPVETTVSAPATETPPAPEKKAVDSAALSEAVTKSYAAPVLHTQGTAKIATGELAFDTVWTPDHENGSGTITFNGKKANTFLFKQMIMIHNEADIVGDLIGKPVPLQQWIIVNADDDINNIYPLASLLAPVASSGEVRQEAGHFVTGPYTLDLNEDSSAVTRVTAPQGSWSIEPGNGPDIKVPGPDFRAEGKIEKDPSTGQWKVFRFAG